ncbi:MAG TPA: hypothetical protein VN894_13680 [Polyangiaceae bacterium]|nr:hypothetical protein [Polyangiaceae bacterium]
MPWLAGLGRARHLALSGGGSARCKARLARRNLRIRVRWMTAFQTGSSSTEAIREHLERENDLLGSRTTWVVTSQAFLFSAYAICVTGGGTEQFNRHAASIEVLIALLPWTAVLSLLLFYVTLVGGLAAMAKLRRSLRTPDGVLRGNGASRMAGLVAPVLTPAVFLLTWLAVLRFQ